MLNLIERRMHDTILAARMTQSKHVTNLMQRCQEKRHFIRAILRIVLPVFLVVEMHATYSAATVRVRHFAALAVEGHVAIEVAVYERETD